MGVLVIIIIIIIIFKFQTKKNSSGEKTIWERRGLSPWMFHPCNYAL
jgi:hypothetical protein